MPQPRRNAGTDAPFDAVAEAERILALALERGASDVHVEPMATGYELRLRVDGLLEAVRRLEIESGRGVVTRLMVMAQLLTYRQDVPQEGRLAFAVANSRIVAMRVAVMPTTHGLRAVVRLPADAAAPLSLDALGLPAAVVAGLEQFARADSGMLLLTGPAGSGKTTTIYALLDHIARTSPGLSIIALEDPVERDLPGVTQIEVTPFGELTYAKALRGILRQDPQVLMLGEIRDSETASIAVQAALSGHRLISTLHAGTCGGAVARLLEMQLEPAQITSALFGVVSQRLLRRGSTSAGYRGRFPAAQLGLIRDAARAEILRRSDAAAIEAAFARQPGYATLRAVMEDAVARGVTDEAEVNRVAASSS